MDASDGPGGEALVDPAVVSAAHTALAESGEEDALPPLDPAEMRRYARHLVLPEVGEEGQRRLKAARVLLVGAGGLGSPAALYLAAAGVGRLGIVDHDAVDLTNLQRQILHGTSDVGRSKLDSAVDRLREVNPHVVVDPHPTRLTSADALDVLAPYDVVLDGSDNFPTRYLVNDACVILGKPNVYGSIHRFDGQVSLFGAPDGPCYRCLFREPPPPGLVPSCAEAGVLGVLPGIIGSLQAMEAIKWILGVGEPLVGRLVIFDALDMTWREVRVARNPECPVCAENPTQTGLIDYEIFCGVAPEQDGDAVGLVGARELASRLASDDPPLVLDVREPWEWAVGSLEGQGALHVPLAELETRLGEVPRDRDVVVVCRAGGRSARAALTLREAGLARVANLRGGLVAWAAEVDPTLPVA
ncbi:MAG: molybdopterin-synthase adenylyltransferase MoeB [Gemmatimonadetes bacterium]|nr:molybdopterin-synthase adenylyltransferase MoeB [Gemmatimonadota bacterium]